MEQQLDAYRHIIDWHYQYNSGPRTKLLNFVYFNNHVPCIFYYFVLWPTNTQLFHKLSHSYIFRHYRVILRELVINTLPSYTSISNAAVGRGQLNCDGTCSETRFRLSAKRTSPFKSVGASVQSTTGSRGVRISSNNAGYTMFRGSVKGTGYPLHSPVSPSLALPCVTVCHHISTGV